MKRRIVKERLNQENKQFKNNNKEHMISEYKKCKK